MLNYLLRPSHFPLLPSRTLEQLAPLSAVLALCVFCGCSSAALLFLGQSSV